jgi:hypothetical protein
MAGIRLDGENFSPKQRQTLLDHMWLCSNADPRVVRIVERRVAQLIEDGENTPEQLVAFVKDMNDWLRRSIEHQCR